MRKTWMTAMLTIALTAALANCTWAQTAGEAVTEEAVTESTGEETNAEAEAEGLVKATRTYTLQNATGSVITELYVYPTDGGEKGENLAGDGLDEGEQVQVTVTGYMLHTENETLFTVEYVADGTTYSHTTVHVEDQLIGQIVYLVAADGVSSATALSFGSSNMEEDQLQTAVDEAETYADTEKAEDNAETTGEVKATRTYTFENAMEAVVSELYVYATDGEGKGENLAGDGLEPGEQVQATITGYMLHTENETLFTVEYVADGTTYSHTTLHVEDLLDGVTVYLVGADGVSSATALSFGDSNL